jgi:hypothetical protein
MTQDNLSVKVDAVTFVTVVDPSRALFQVEDYRHAVKTLAASTLLRIIAEHDLQQIFTNRSQINTRLTQTMQEKTAGWGVEVSSVELRDITIPDAMQRAMAQIAEANREADSKVIVAEGQRRAAAIFADAAEIMNRQPMSLQLQWFETLTKIAGEKNSTVIVPDTLIGSFSDIARASREKATGENWRTGEIASPSLVVPSPINPIAPATLEARQSRERVEENSRSGESVWPPFVPTANSLPATLEASSRPGNVHRLVKSSEVTSGSC